MCDRLTAARLRYLSSRADQDARDVFHASTRRKPRIITHAPTYYYAVENTAKGKRTLARFEHALDRDAWVNGITVKAKRAGNTRVSVPYSILDDYGISPDEWRPRQFECCVHPCSIVIL